MDAPTPELDAVPAGPPPEPPPPPVRKSALAFLAFVLPLYFVLGGAAQAANPLLGLGWSQLFALVLPAVVVAAGSNLRPGPALLLARRPARAQLLLAILVGALAFFAAGALMSLTSLLLPARWLEIFDVSRLFDRPPLERAALWVAAATLAPLCEELVFRGWVLSALRSEHRTGAALALSGLFFAVMHLDPVRFAAVLALGVVYAWLDWRAGSIWPSVVAHAVNNGLGAVLAATGLAETSPRAPRQQPLATAAGALVTLAVAATLLRIVATAYQRATPAPPPLEEALVRSDPSDPSTAFRWWRVPQRWLAAGLVGAAGLMAIGVVGLLARR